MKKSSLNRFLTGLFILLLILVPFKQVNAKESYPEPTNLKYVNDYIGILDNETKEYIVSVGKELEDKTGAQAVVVIINSLEGIEIRDYGYKLFREWKIGQKEDNNGLLILLSMKERTWSVEVGRGLEGVIPDILSNRVMKDIAVPKFKTDNYGKGLKNAYSIFVDHIAEEYNVTLNKSENIYFDYKGTTDTKRNPIPIYFVLGLVFLDLIFNRGRIIKFILKMLFWNSFFGGGRGGRGGPSGGGFGGFGGGDTGGGGSSGNW
ncbi:TPM domain-containing protein [Clostridium aestuarii]|uniref:TPM domain-containing protein n=1 Tax=Clostridium aestuarii TaxID=338193 RepID=A0ABT4CZS2_9CLOT|nr:TPM domain-containing protein [Clostridium aestuarii]MCY6484489.1 TPM domain-containing protein [Clostridium aestuarii]